LQSAASIEVTLKLQGQESQLVLLALTPSTILQMLLAEKGMGPQPSSPDTVD